MVTVDAHHIRRIATNSRRFRRINDHVAARLEGLGAPARRRHDFVCECALTQCSDAISMSLEEYRSASMRAGWFVVKPLHLLPAGELVVQCRTRFWTISKHHIDGDAPTDDQRLGDRLRTLDHGRRQRAVIAIVDIARRLVDAEQVRPLEFDRLVGQLLTAAHDLEPTPVVARTLERAPRGNETTANDRAH